MTIEIDDAGTGDLLGPAFIGMYRRETGQEQFWEIPLAAFCDPGWQEKQPFAEARRIVQEGVETFQVAKDEPIYLCRGNIFDRAREWLTEEGYAVHDHVVEGHLQDAVEQRLVDEFRAMGITDSKLTTTSGRDRYFVLFRWLVRDFPNRERHVKAGFKGWKRKWRAKARAAHQNLQRNRRRPRDGARSREGKNSRREHGGRDKPRRDRDFTQKRRPHRLQ